MSVCLYILFFATHTTSTIKQGGSNFEKDIQCVVGNCACFDDYRCAKLVVGWYFHFQLCYLDYFRHGVVGTPHLHSCGYRRYLHAGVAYRFPCSHGWGRKNPTWLQVFSTQNASQRIVLRQSNGVNGVFAPLFCVKHLHPFVIFGNIVAHSANISFGMWLYGQPT